MDDVKMIYAAIPAIMADIGAIGKEKMNQQQGFKFRGIDDVMNALKPLLTKHQVFTVPEVLEQTREVKLTKSGSEMRYSLLRVRFRFFATDGSYVEAITLGEGMDSGDKASNKAMAIAYKYALFQTFCIPTEEMTDPDATTPEETKLATKAAPATADKPATICARCGKAITAHGECDAHRIANGTIAKYGQPLCWDCSKKAAAEEKAS